MAKLETVDDFLGHSGFEGGGGNYLKTWKKNGVVDPKDPSARCLDSWMHCKALPQPRWCHRWQKIEIRENRETRNITKEVWSLEFVCHEEESVLKKQYRRTDSGQREAFPEFCPSCRLTECVYQLVTTGKFIHDGKLIAKAGKLDWTEPLFSFDATDATKNVILHAAGIYNGYKDVETDSDDAKMLKDAGIYLKSAFKENTMAKLSYMFAIVDNADVSKGIQITEETGLLGDRVKAVIAKERESNGEDDGNPFVNPYSIRWKYYKDAHFDKKYDALRYNQVKLTEDIARHIRSERKDWFAAKLRQGDAATLRSILEKHACEAATRILPWDWIFDGVEASNARPAKPPEERPAAPAAASPAVPAAPAAAKPTGRVKVSKPAALPPPPPEPERIPCDDCGNLMLATESKCSKCGAEYQVSDSPQNGTTAPVADADSSATDDEFPF